RGVEGEDEECCLKRILSISLVVQDAAADAEHERPVASQQRLEGFLLAADDESLQQLSIAQRVIRYRTQAAHDLSDPAARHHASPCEAPRLPHGTARSRTVSYTFRTRSGHVWRPLADLERAQPRCWHGILGPLTGIPKNWDGDEHDDRRRNPVLHQRQGERRQVASQERGWFAPGPMPVCPGVRSRGKMAAGSA